MSGLGPRPGSRAVRVSLAPASAVEGLDPAIVDPDVAANQLRCLDDERAILSPAGGGDPSSILLLPAEPTDTLGVVSREVVVDG